MTAATGGMAGRRDAGHPVGMRALPLLCWLAACPGTPPDSESDPETDSEETDVPCEEVDRDQDGFNLCDDCDDGDNDYFPGAVERCDGVDGDCDGAPAPSEIDADHDGTLDCQSCEAAGFWRSTQALTDRGEIVSTLREIMDDLRCGYSEAGDFMFLRLDNHDGVVTCVYTGRTTTVTNQRPNPNNDMNIEHTWPQSQGADNPPPECDLHHLYPTDVDANSRRANHPFGEVVSGTEWSEGGSTLGRNASGDRAFEPRDAHKGNVARSMLYMSLHYEWTLSQAQIDLFQAWHDQDPPDAAEVERSFDIAEHQEHANPFVVCPDLVDRAWP